MRLMTPNARRVSELRWVALVCLFALGAFGTGIQPQPASPRPGELRSLKLVNATPENVGVVNRGAAVGRSLEFKNVLTSPVKVEVISKTCGCIGAAFDNVEVPAGGQTTLNFSLSVAPAAAEQVHTVTFRATWQDGGVDRTERGTCAIKYRTRLSWLVQPQAAAVAAIDGQEAYADIFVVATAEEGPLPELTEPRVTFANWTLRRVEGASPHPAVAHFRASGPAPGIGVCDGTISLTTDSPSEPKITVPIRVRTLSRFRAFPGGATFTRGSSDGPTTQILHLYPRATTHGDPQTPSSAQLESTNSWISAEILPDGTLGIHLSPGADMPIAGSTRCKVIAGDGTQLVSVPIAWWTRQETPANAKP